MLPLLFLSGFVTFTLCVPRQYIFVNESKTWTEAQSYCRDKYTDLLTIANEQETIQLLDTVNDYNSIDLAWIGLYDDLNVWKWTLEDSDFFKKGEKQFRNWYNSGPGNYGENGCVLMYNGIWYAASCNYRLTFFCYDGRQNASASYVFVYQYKTWTEAQRYCREHHTDLVSIRNETENQKIQYLLNYYDTVWIGLYKNRSWSDQSNSTFSNWNTGEPDSNGHCTAVSLNDSKWTDDNCNISLPFFCYNVSSLTSFRQYHFISVNKSWSDAQRYCRENYTDLATIDNMDEMISLMNTVNGTYNGSAWIGLYDDLNSWRWSLEDNDFYKEGERDFRNWFHEPDNNGGKELCVYMNHAGNWFDSSCDNMLSFVCYNGNNNTQSYIRINDRKTWTEARRYCRVNYTDLVNVRNMSENQMILQSTGGDVWIGLYRNRIWSNGQMTNYENWRPDIPYSEAQPDNGNNDYRQWGNQHCTAVSLSHLGRWKDENCFSNISFICYSRNCTQSSCSRRQYHFISVNKSWSDAQRYCRENYTDLATIYNMDEMNRLIKTVNGSYRGLAWIGLYDDIKSWRWSLGNRELEGGFKSWNVQQPVNWYGQSLCVSMSYYTGIWYEDSCFSTRPFICYDGRHNASESYVYVNDWKTWTEAQRYCRENHTDLVSIKNETENQQIQNLFKNYWYYHYSVWIGLYRTRSWSDQSNSTFSNWRTGEPDGVGYCTVVSFSDNGTWTDENCNSYLPFICYNVSSLTSSRQYHFVFEYKSWSDAQRYCRENYTDLATIDNMDEMNSLMNTVNGTYNGSAWIGLYDDLNKWKWSLEDNNFYQEGERDFRNWYHQPDNIRGNELCVYMSHDGSWFDWSCDDNFQFVCYDGRGNTSQNYVLVQEYRSWSEAQRYCREVYTDLASVTNETEHKQILNITRGDNVWIGLYRNRLWSDQSNSTFTYWLSWTRYYAPQPDNGASFTGQTQQCTAVSLQYAGQWSDERCFDRLPFFCYGDKYVAGLRLAITSKENLSEFQIEQFVIKQLQREFIKLGLPSNFTMSLRNYRKIGP